MAVLDADAAVAALVAAGSDRAALATAIAAAAFLDAAPGEPRQKVRAARTRLKKLIKEGILKKREDALYAVENRSPHTKEVYDSGDFSILAGKYESLNWKIISKPGGATIKRPEFYALYGCHMQALQGNNAAERPMWAEKGGLDFDGRERWDAWTAMKDVDRASAELKFVQRYYEFTPKALYKDTRG